MTSDLYMCVRIAWWVMKLGEVRRATLHPDGTTAETDTTHSVMLALIAWRMATLSNEGPLMEDPNHPPLDTEMVLLFALVHDLPEALAGDVNTARGLTKAQRLAKRRAEEQAIVGMRRDVPELAVLVERYERQKEPEAQFVRYLDKVMPKLTHLMNDGEAIRADNIDLPELMRLHCTQGERLQRQMPEQDTARALFNEACGAAEAAYKRSEA